MINSPLGPTVNPRIRFPVIVGFLMTVFLFLVSCETPLPIGYGVIDVLLVPPPGAAQKAVALAYLRNPDTLKRTVLKRAEIDEKGRASFVLKQEFRFGIQVFWDDNDNLRREANELQASVEGISPSPTLHNDFPVRLELPPNPSR